MKARQILFLILFLFYEIIGYAQQHNFTTYSVTEGLAQSQVQTIIEDRQGYLWLGTYGGGLCRFDGAKFVTYTTQDGLSSNYIHSLFEDEAGTIWIGTTNGISQFKNDSLLHLSQFSTVNIVHDFEQDDTGEIWLVDGHLNYFDNLGNAPFSKGMGNDFRRLFKSKSGQIWAAGKKGLFQVINNRLVEIKSADGNSFRDIRAMTETTDGVIWIAAYNQGIFLSDGYKILRKLSKSDGVLSLKIQSLTTTQNGSIWLGTADKGVIIWKPKTRNFESITTLQGLPNNNIQSILEDSWGNIWLGTAGGGLSNYGGQQFEHFTQLNGLAGNYIQALAVDSKDQLWVAPASSGVQLFKEGQFINFSENSTIDNSICTTIFEDNLGHLWFGTQDNGITVFLDSLLLNFTKENGLADNQITDIKQDTSGKLWIASANYGLSQLIWNDSLPSQSTFKNFTKETGLPSNQVNTLHIDTQNRIWVATNGGGIALIDQDSIIKIFTQQDGLLENIVRSFSEDHLGFLWYGTASYGIGNIDLNDSNFRMNNHYEQLASNNIKLLKNDKNNDLWIGSERGLNYLKLDVARNIISSDYFGQREGFKGIETSLNTVVQDKDNNLWFGTVNGLTKYNQSVQQGRIHPPTIHWESIQLFGQDLQIPTDETPIKSYGSKLPYDQNELSFRVESVHLSYPDALQYQWQLENIDKDWSKPTVNNTYQRTFLPGKYQLKVRAITKNQTDNASQTLVFPIEITSPIWQTSSFKVIASLIGLLLISLFIKWRINLVQQKAKRIQNKLEQDKKLLELEQKALQLQMNPHFIFNALNSIQGVITPTDIKTARLQLAKFSKLMRATLENARTDTISLEDEINTLTNYLSLEQFSRGNTFDYAIIVADTIDAEDVYLPSMILQPFVENAIVHGVAHLEKRGQIKIEFTRKGKRLSCSIEDNGIGRAKAKTLKSQIAAEHKSAALDITRERLNLLRNGKAAQNSLEIIDLVDGEGNALGTRVEVIIPVEED